MTSPSGSGPSAHRSVSAAAPGGPSQNLANAAPMASGLDPSPVSAAGCAHTSADPHYLSLRSPAAAPTPATAKPSPASAAGRAHVPAADRDATAILDLAEYRPGSGAVLTDAERWPTANSVALARLAHWRGHPDAPVWTHATGDRLTADQAARVRRPLPTDAWLPEHLAAARRTLRYRHVPATAALADFPTVCRADLAADIAAFIPVGADLTRMVHGTSSGSTGAALEIPDDVEDVARTFHLMLDLARRCGVTVGPEPSDRMVLANLVAQRQAYTYVSLVSSFGMRAMARINLHLGCWPGPAERRRFLAAADPEILAGHPASLAALLQADVARVLHPRVVFSGAMDLAAPLRHALETAFGCPVIDVYGLHETRPLAWRADDGPFRILDTRVVVETVDDRGAPARDGEVGEITVTVGANPLLPLVRYRTGDYGRLVRLADGAAAIADLQGRENVMFTAADGSDVPSVDLTQQLQARGVWGWAVEQDAAGRIRARIVGGDTGDVRAALAALVGRPIDDVSVDRAQSMADLGEGKPRRFRRTAGADAGAEQNGTVKR